MKFEELSRSDRNTIGKWHQRWKKEVNLDLLLNQDKRSNGLHLFCKSFSALAPNVSFTPDRSETAYPTIQINDRMLFQAIPVGRELPPFLEAIQGLSKKENDLPEDIRNLLKEVKVPASLKLFITTHCPFCPDMVRLLTPLVLAHHQLRLTVIDGSLFPEEAQRHQVQSAPTLIIDDHFRWTGTPPIQEIVSVLAHRDPAGLGVESIKGLLSEGKASRIAEMMLAKKEIFQSFWSLLVHEKWPIRLGAMVVVEEILEKDAGLAKTIITPLIQRFDDLDDTIRGDLLYLFGLVGEKDTIFQIQQVIQKSNSEEIKKLGQEAITSIRERM
jgi:hypothetical protein